MSSSQTLKLTEQQLEFINLKAPYIFLNAPAGSGKTTVLLERIKNRHKEHRILFWTYNVKISQTIQEKLGNTDHIDVETIHSTLYKAFCDINDKTPILLDKIPSDIQNESNVTTSLSSYRTLKNKMLEHTPPVFTYQLLEYDALFEFVGYIKRLGTYNLLIIDEFQDVNIRILQFISKAIKALPQLKIIAAGDFEQSIYSFQQVDVKKSKNFLKKHRFEVINLNHNFRSAREIVTFISNYIGYQLYPKNQTDGTLKCIQYTNLRTFISAFGYSLHKVLYQESFIPELLDITTLLESSATIAVLTRTLKEANLISEYLKKYDIPHINIARISKDMSKLTHIVEKALLQRKSEVIKAVNPKTKGLAPEIQAFWSNFIGKIHNGGNLTLLNELREAIKHYKQDIAASDTTPLKILTIHASKGLEFDGVIIPDISPLFVHLKPYQNSEEEKRLFYVAISRAKSLLWIGYPKNVVLPSTIEKILKHVLTISIDLPKKPRQTVLF